MASSIQVTHRSLVNRSPIFYGWVVWFVALIGMIATSPGQSFSVSIFFDYIRYAKDPSDYLIIIMNFTPVVREHYQLGVPEAGFYKEMLNSDSEMYGGSNVGNIGGVQSHNLGKHGLPHSVSLTVPPFGILILKKED